MDKMLSEHKEQLRRREEEREKEKQQLEAEQEAEKTRMREQLESHKNEIAQLRKEYMGSLLNLAKVEVTLEGSITHDNWHPSCLFELIRCYS